MDFDIEYGIENTKKNITEQVYEKCKVENFLIIPSNDIERAVLFGDPKWGVEKHIYIRNKINQETYEFDGSKDIFIDLQINQIYIDEELPKYRIDQFIQHPFIEKYKDFKLHLLQYRLKIDFGTLDQEYQQQKMICLYIKGHEKVLEIGGNIGRSSLITGYILNKAKNNQFVVLECNENFANQLRYNRNQNHLNFFVEDSALSKREFVQRDFVTIPSSKEEEGYKKVKTITNDELQQKYNIDFDTLIVDCEGAFFYILSDMPEILQNIKLIIMKNDYSDIAEKKYVNGILERNHFHVDYSHEGGWGPCYKNFYEVWIKRDT